MKRSEIKRRPLADTVLASLEPEEKEYRENYGSDGIYFAVKPNGSKRWILRYKDSNNSWRWSGLGTYPATTAKMARDKAQAFIKELQKEGTSPVDKKKGEKRDATVKGVFELFYQKQKLNKVSQKQLNEMNNAFERHVLPFIGKTPIYKVTVQECFDIQKRLQDRGTFSTADKIRSWLNRTFRHAVACGLTDTNPASYLIDASIKRPPSQNFPYLLEDELPDFLRALRESRYSTHTTLSAAWLVIYTASRPGMVRWAEWSEFDFEEKTWTIEADKMKMKKAHIIPLTNQVIALLESLKEYTGHSKYLFPSDYATRQPVMSDATINKAFSLIGYKRKMTGHGSRHTFKTLVAEHGWNKDWSELQLAHTKKGIEDVYNKAQYLKPRAIMMQWYNDYLNALEQGITEQQSKEFAARVNKVIDYDD